MATACYHIISNTAHPTQEYEAGSSCREEQDASGLTHYLLDELLPQAASHCPEADPIDKCDLQGRPEALSSVRHGENCWDPLLTVPANAQLCTARACFGSTAFNNLPFQPFGPCEGGGSAVHLLSRI